MSADPEAALLPQERESDEALTHDDDGVEKPLAARASDPEIQSPRDLNAEKERVKKLVVTALKPPVMLARSIRGFLLRAASAGALMSLLIAGASSQIFGVVAGVLFGVLAVLPALVIAMVAWLLSGVVDLSDNLCQVLDSGAELLSAEDEAELKAIAVDDEQAAMQKRPSLLRRIYDGGKRLLAVKRLFDHTQDAFTSTTKVVLIANPIGAAIIGLSLAAINVEVFVAIGLVLYALT